MNSFVHMCWRIVKNGATLGLPGIKRKISSDVKQRHRRAADPLIQVGTFDPSRKRYCKTYFTTLQQYCKWHNLFLDAIRSFYQWIFFWTSPWQLCFRREGPAGRQRLYTDSLCKLQPFLSKFSHFELSRRTD